MFSVKLLSTMYCMIVEVVDFYFNARQSHCLSELTKTLYFLLDKCNQGKSKKLDPTWKRDHQVHWRGQRHLQRGMKIFCAIS